MKNKIYNISFGLLLFGLSNLQAQETVLSSGGEAIGTGGNVSYSVGQTTFTTQSGTNGSVEAGVQQSYSIVTSSGLELTTIQLELTVFPNPTQNRITLKVEDYRQEQLTYYLFDIHGKLVESNQISSDRTIIQMHELPAATYFFKVQEGSKTIKTFNIIKN